MLFLSCVDPIIMNGIEFLFLDDIAKSLSLSRENEALLILSIIAGMQDKGETSESKTTIELTLMTTVAKRNWRALSGQKQGESDIFLHCKRCGGDRGVKTCQKHPLSTMERNLGV